ncbi:MAG: flagellar basal body protein FliL [Proteobacteria bacterium]|nr:flagellar basal body protein FliL [Pseudomonadota bacterium]NOG58943.1 flagellar basal body protein FliL [Pseudomonadota bacterium]
MADGDTLDNAEELEKEGSKKKLPLKLIIIIAAVVLIGGGAGAFFMIGDKSTEDAAVSENAEGAESEQAEDGEEGTGVAEAHYFSLDPPFIVNFTGKSRARFLQVSIEGMTRDAKVKEDITKHIPQVRNNLVLLLSAKTHEELNSPEGKAALRKQVLKEIQKVLEAETGKEGVEDVYFTSFVMQ